MSDSTAEQSSTRSRRFAARSTAAALWQHTTDLLLPPRCLACRVRVAAPNNICGRCWRELHFIRPPLCDRLGTPMAYGADDALVSAAALADPPDFDRARAVARYDGRMRTLIHQFKFNDRHDLRVLFGRWLASAGEPLLADCHLILPVPLHRRRLLSRRFNQSAMLAIEVGGIAGVEVLPDGLLRVRRTRPQVGLSEDQRRLNVQRAFRLTPAAAARINGRNVLLVDDVVTTGATVNACARVLRRAGASRVNVLALALVGVE